MINQKFIKEYFLTSLFIVLILFVNAQNGVTSTKGTDTDKNEQPPEFKNAGEQEDYWAKELFRKFYKKEYFELYKGKIEIQDSNYIFDNKVIDLSTESAELKVMIESGLFYPGIFDKYDYSDSHISIKLLATSRKKIASDTDSAKPKAPLSTNRLKKDTLTISNFEEIKAMQTNIHQKRFRFWLFTKGIGNPIIYFIELTNDKATVDMSTVDFVKGAKLTFLKEGWVII